MSEEIRKNEFTDDQAEQASGGRRRPRSPFNMHPDKTAKSKLTNGANALDDDLMEQVSGGTCAWNQVASFNRK